MKLLKKENWWVWLLLTLFTSGSSILLLAALLDCLDKNAWYAKWQNWLIGLLCFVFPISIMMIVFMISMLSQVAAKLDIKGKELYLSPYVWILCLIVPILGWFTFMLLYIYLIIMIIIKLKDGKGEKYI